MDSSPYVYSALSLKYGSFMAPGCEICVGSFKMVGSSSGISELVVEQTADGSAGGCHIRITGFYDYDSTSWNSKLTNALQVGAKLSVKTGYIKKKEIFLGYVDEYTFEYSEDTAPAVIIDGLDALGYLMSVRSRVFAGEKKVGDVVKQLLQDATSAGAAKSVTVSPSLQDMTVQRIKDGEDSYSFLNTLAKQLGMQFLCIDGEVIFDDLKKKTSPVVTLSTTGGGLFSFSKRLSAANQPSKVIVHGRDINNEPIKGEATSTNLSGDGKAAASVASKLLKKSVYEEDSPLALTADECKKLAQARFNDLAQHYVFGTGECVGIPEISAGRYIKLAGMDKTTNGTYFLTRVTHILNSDGYSIRFEVGGAKSK